MGNVTSFAAGRNQKSSVFHVGTATQRAQQLNNDEELGWDDHVAFMGHQIKPDTPDTFLDTSNSVSEINQICISETSATLYLAR